MNTPRSNTAIAKKLSRWRNLKHEEQLVMKLYMMHAYVNRSSHLSKDDLRFANSESFEKGPDAETVRLSMKGVKKAWEIMRVLSLIDEPTREQLHRDTLPSWLRTAPALSTLKRNTSGRV
jgi:hypothetical protein